jgi:hypothetical protein
MLFSKLDLLIKTLDDDIWSEASDFVNEKVTKKTNFRR